METTILKHQIPSLGEGADIQKALTSFGESIHNVIVVDSAAEMKTIAGNNTLSTRAFPLFFWDTNQEALFIVRNKNGAAERLAGKNLTWVSKLRIRRPWTEISPNVTGELEFHSPDSGLITSGWVLSSSSIWLAAPETGVYMVSVGGAWSGGAPYEITRSVIQIVKQRGGMLARNATCNDDFVQFSHALYLEAGEQIGFQVFHASSWNRSFDGNVNIFRIN